MATSPATWLLVWSAVLGIAPRVRISARLRRVRGRAWLRSRHRGPEQGEPHGGDHVRGHDARPPWELEIAERIRRGVRAVYADGFRADGRHPQGHRQQRPRGKLHRSSLRRSSPPSRLRRNRAVGVGRRAVRSGVPASCSLPVAGLSWRAVAGLSWWQVGFILFARQPTDVDCRDCSCRRV